MEKTSRTKKDLALWTVAFLLPVVLAVYSIYSISLLTGKINDALFQNLTNGSLIIRFDFDNLDKVLAGKGISR